MVLVKRQHSGEICPFKLRPEERKLAEARDQQWWKKKLNDFLVGIVLFPSAGQGHSLLRVLSLSEYCRIMRDKADIVRNGRYLFDRYMSCPRDLHA